MVIGKSIAFSVHILVHITDLQVGFTVQAIAGSDIKPVLVKYFSIHFRAISNIQKYFVLQSGKKAPGKFSLLLKG